MKPSTLLLTLVGTIFLGLIFLFSSFFDDFSQSTTSTLSIKKLDNQTINPPSLFYLNNKDISIIVSDTPTTREKGLSGMESLPEDSAMLFIFEKPDKYGIWMKDMKFPIDIIWFDEEYRITHIESNISPDTFTKVFYPPEASRYVLETNAGFTKENYLKINGILDFK